MRFSSSLFKPFVLAAVLCAAASARADITVYTSEAAFLAAIQAPGVDSFDDLEVQAYGELLHRSAGAYGYDAYAAGKLWGAGSTGDYWLSNNLPGNPIVFSNFSGGVQAFGGNFFTSNIAGQDVSGNLVLTAIDGSTLSYNMNNTVPGDFLGFVSSAPLAGVVLGTDGGNYWPTANNVVLAVPEPKTYALLLAGLCFVAVMGRRRH